MNNKFLVRYINGDRSLGSRLGTMRLALGLLDHTRENIFVETGTTRKNLFNTRSVEERAADGCSTVLFGDYCSKYGGKVFTCDINLWNIDNCKIATEEYKQYITYIVDDSVKFLREFNQPIDFLYLDSVDSHEPNANEHQLMEIETAIRNLHKNSVVVLDDLGSKTNLSIPFLRKNNWCQIKIDIPNPSTYNNFSQGIFVREDFLFVDHLSISIDKRYRDI